MVVQRNPAIHELWLMKTCTFPMEIMKVGAQSLQMKIRNAKLYLKEATVIYGFQPLAARLCELESKLERLHVDCSHLFNSKRRSKFSTDYSLGERRYKIVEVHFTETTEEVATKQACITTMHVSVA